MRRLFRTSLILLASFLFLTMAGSVLVYLYRKDIQNHAIAYLNKKINTTAEVKGVKAGMLRHFPYISVTFKEVTILSSLPYRKVRKLPDTLLHAYEVVLDLNIYNLLVKKEITIERVEIEGGSLELAATKKGIRNWEIFKKGGSGGQRQTRTEIGNIRMKDVKVKYYGEGGKKLFEGIVARASFSERRFQQGKILRLKAVHMRALTERQPFTWEEIDISTVIEQQPGEGLSFEGSLHSGRLPEVAFSGEWLKRNLHLYFSVRKISPAILLRSGLLKMEKGSLPVEGGSFDLHGVLKAQTSGRTSWSLKVKGEGFGQTVKMSLPEPVRLVSWHGHLLASGGEKRSTRYSLEITDLSLVHGSSELRGNFGWKGKDSPLTGRFSGVLALPEWNALFGGDRVFGKGKGEVSLQVSIPYRLFERKKKFSFREVGLQGDILLKDFQVFLPGEITGREARVQILEDHRLHLQATGLHAAGSLWKVNGFVARMDDYLEKKIPLQITGTLATTRVELDTLIGFFRKPPRPGLPDEVVKDPLPRFSLDFSCDTFLYEGVESLHLRGTLLYHDPVLQMRGLSAEALGGSLGGQLTIRFEKGGKLDVRSYAELAGIDVHRLFASFSNFGQDFIRAENLRGKVTGNIAMQALFDTSGKVIPESILSDSYLTLSDGALIGFEPLYKLSTFIRLSELKEIRFSRLENEVFIRDETVVIPQMHVNSSAFDLDIGGKHHFDGRFEYHIRVYLADYLARKAKKANQGKDLDLVVEPGKRNTSLFLIYRSDGNRTRISYDRRRTRQKMSRELKKEKEELKALFKKESAEDTLPVNRDTEKKIRVVWPEEKPDSGTTTGTKREGKDSSTRKFRLIWEEEEEPDSLPNFLENCP